MLHSLLISIGYTSRNPVSVCRQNIHQVFKVLASSLHHSRVCVCVCSCEGYAVLSRRGNCSLTCHSVSVCGHSKTPVLLPPQFDITQWELSGVSCHFFSISTSLYCLLELHNPSPASHFLHNQLCEGLLSKYNTFL